MKKLYQRTRISKNTGMTRIFKILLINILIILKKNTLIILMIVAVLGCSPLKITRIGYTVDEKLLKNKVNCPVMFRWLIPSGSIDTIDAKKIGKIVISCNEKNLEIYIKKEACIIGSNFVNVISESEPDFMSDTYTYEAEFYTLNTNSLLYNRLDYLKADTLTYSADRRLSWDDFKGHPEKSENIHKSRLITSIFINNEVNIWFGKQKSHVLSVIFRDKSWILPEYKTDEYLNHLQVLADISALYAFKLDKQIKDSAISTRDDKKFVKLLNHYIMESYVIQDLYEKETLFGDDKSTQSSWEEKISNELREFIK